LENRDNNVHALAICPGWINTRLSMDPNFAGIGVADILGPEQISEFLMWVLQQPSSVRIGPIIPITPMKEKASFLNGAKVFFEIHKDLT
jgi:NADP-dependent 3-hydroxy acid dehydrogenase YdfG